MKNSAARSPRHRWAMIGKGITTMLLFPPSLPSPSSPALWSPGLAIEKAKKTSCHPAKRHFTTNRNAETGERGYRIARDLREGRLEPQAFDHGHEFLPSVSRSFDARGPRHHQLPRLKQKAGSLRLSYSHDLEGWAKDKSRRHEIAARRHCGAAAVALLCVAFFGHCLFTSQPPRAHDNKG